MRESNKHQIRPTHPVCKTLLSVLLNCLRSLKKKQAKLILYAILQNDPKILDVITDLVQKKCEFFS